MKGKFRGKIIKSYSHSLGRWIILIVEFNQQYFVLGNIYATNSVVKNKSLLQDFEEKIRNILDSFSDAKIILGGDYNSVWDNNLDCIPPRGNSLNNFNELHNLCLGLDLIDIWRVKNPNKQEFTWCSGDRSKQSRIDFWLISSVLQNQVGQVTIETSVLTDHKVIYLVIVLNGNIGNNIRTRTHWKLNKAILENELFKKEVKNIILSCLNNARRSNKFGANWEYMKYLIRKQAIVRGKLIAQFKRTKEEQVIKEIVDLTSNNVMNQQDKFRLFDLQLQLDKMYEYKAKGAFVRSRGRWLEEGEKNSRYFFNLEKRNNELNSVLKLSINGDMSEDLVKISNHISTFY